MPPIRKQMERRETPGGVRFLTFSCHRRLPLLGHPGARDVLARALNGDAFRRSAALFAWVVMPEHVHLLLRPRTPVDGDQRTVAGMLHALKTSVARTLIARLRRARDPVLDSLTIERGTLRFWQAGGGFDRNVRDMAELSRAIRYIHQNPVERGLVAHPLDWEWSSARWWNGDRDGVVTCENPPSNGGDWSRWKGWM